MESRISIRKVVKDDLISIFQQEEEAFKPKHYPLFVLRQFYDMSPELFFVAVNESDKIIGYCFGGINNQGETAWVFALAVLPSDQNKKIGQRLTLELISAMKKKNIKTIKLTTSLDNHVAIGLYEKLGFIKLKEDSSYYFDDVPRWIMKLSVT